MPVEPRDVRADADHRFTSLACPFLERIGGGGAGLATRRRRPVEACRAGLPDVNRLDLGMPAGRGTTIAGQGLREAEWLIVEIRDTSAAGASRPLAGSPEIVELRCAAL